jgi:hypothetical protein
MTEKQWTEETLDELLDDLFNVVASYRRVLDEMAGLLARGQYNLREATGDLDFFLNEDDIIEVLDQVVEVQMSLAVGNHVRLSEHYPPR